MATLAEIQTAVDQGTLYHGELVEELRADLINGCDCNCGGKLICLQASIYALQYDINTDTNTDLTTRVYNVLQGLIAGFSGAFNPDPTVVIPNTTVVIGSGTILQTGVVYPTPGDSSYTFPELIGTEALTAYRGTGTVLRFTTGSPTNEFAQIDYTTGVVTVSYAFGDDESFWIEYKTS
jgi:hypothetical protein